MLLSIGAKARDQESLRLVPYWTERILSRAPDLNKIGRIASMAFERLDGSGWHRGLTADDVPLSARIVQLAVNIAEVQIKSGNSYQDSALIEAETAGWLDTEVVDAFYAKSALSPLSREPEQKAEIALTAREREVLGHLVRGKSNKEIARVLTISPKTVGNHLENCYRKLKVRTRAAAAIKALNLDLLTDVLED